MNFRKNNNANLISRRLDLNRSRFLQQTKHYSSKRYEDRTTSVIISHAIDTFVQCKIIRDAVEIQTRQMLDASKTKICSRDQLDSLTHKTKNWRDRRCQIKEMNFICSDSNSLNASLIRRLRIRTRSHSTNYQIKKIVLRVKNISMSDFNEITKNWIIFYKRFESQSNKKKQRHE
jgi:hypothetical protein